MLAQERLAPCCPDDIRATVEAMLGPAPVAEPLGGMGGGSVVRLRGGGRSAVLKRGRGSIESFVYTVARDRLDAAEVGLPHLYAAADDDGWQWLLLEDIPHPLPRECWLADVGVVGMLRRLHALDPAGLLPDGRYRPAWPREMMAQALSLLPVEGRDDLDALLRVLRDRAMPLFEPGVPISGDPNVANWGLRADGTLVLFDWERFTMGTAALDLAISVPGLGDAADYRAVAECYADGAAATALAGEIAVAKVWSVVEFLAGCARGDTEPAFDLRPLLDAFPGWLHAVAG